jgi:hypothetical protein
LRDHVVGQRLGEERPQVGDAGLLVGVREVGNEPLLGLFLRAGHDHRFPYRRMGRQRHLYLGKLDAKAAHLDLPVDPPQELESPVS